MLPYAYGALCTHSGPVMDGQVCEYVWCESDTYEECASVVNALMFAFRRPGPAAHWSRLDCL